MTARNKFEEMLERLINEDREGAEELFHEIVVEKSREIYQSILESEDEEVDEADDEDLDEAGDDEELEESEDEEVEESDDEDLDEMFGLDEFEVEAPMGGDATDDMMGDMGADDDMGMDGMDDMGGDEMGGDDVESRVQDLEDALEELKAEFEAMMGDDEGEEGDDEMEFGGDEEGEEGDDEMEFGDDDEEKKEEFAFEAKKKDPKKDDKKAKKTAGEEMREYVEKVNGGFGAKIGGDNGANTKSIVAGKNDMGGTTANILRTDTEQGVESAKGHLKGSSLFKGTAKEDNAGNINVPGGKAGKTAFKKHEPGHGAEKKGKPETADKGAVSTLTKLSSRAK
jgi:hypothetical protein